MDFQWNSSNKKLTRRQRTMEKSKNKGREREREGRKKPSHSSAAQNEKGLAPIIASLYSHCMECNAIVRVSFLIYVRNVRMCVYRHHCRFCWRFRWCWWCWRCCQHSHPMRQIDGGPLDIAEKRQPNTLLAYSRLFTLYMQCIH